MSSPDFISIGATGRLISLRAVAKEFACTVAALRSWLVQHDVLPLRRPGSQQYYVHLYTLELALLRDSLDGDWEDAHSHFEIVAAVYGFMDLSAVRQHLRHLARTHTLSPAP